MALRPFFVCCRTTLGTHIACYVSRGLTEFSGKLAYQEKVTPSSDYTNNCSKNVSFVAGGLLITGPLERKWAMC